MGTAVDDSTGMVVRRPALGCLRMAALFADDLLSAVKERVVGRCL